MAVGLAVNGVVLLICVAAAVRAARSKRGPRRAAAMATVTSAVVVAASPFVVAVNRSLAPVQPGAQDLSGAWSWALVVIAAGAAGIAVYLRPTSSDARSVGSASGAREASAPDAVVGDGAVR